MHSIQYRVSAVNSPGILAYTCWPGLGHPAVPSGCSWGCACVVREWERGSESRGVSGGVSGGVRVREWEWGSERGGVRVREWERGSESERGGVREREWERGVCERGEETMYRMVILPYRVISNENCFLTWQWDWWQQRSGRRPCSGLGICHHLPEREGGGRDGRGRGGERGGRGRKGGREGGEGRGKGAERKGKVGRRNVWN